MKKSLIATLAALASLALAAGASAQMPPPGEDIVGIYSNDFDGPTFANVDAAAGQVTVYLIFSNLSRPGIGGWEVDVTQEGTGVMFLSATLFGQGPINLYTAPRFQVGLGVPLTTPTIPDVWPVASMLFFMLSTTPTTLSVGPIPITSWPEDPGPGYANAEDVGDLPRAYTYTGANMGVVFGFNTGPMTPPVNAQDETWGGVKGLFR